MEKQKKITRLTFFTGLMLLSLIGAAVIIVNAISPPSSQKLKAERSFTRLLDEYDFRYKQLIESGQSSFQYNELDTLGEELDELETNAAWFESWLSILKRRKQLAKIDSRLMSAYYQSSQKALLAYPYSPEIASVAASVLINTAKTPETETQLRKILRVLSQSEFITVRLALHVLLNDFDNPQRAYENLMIEDETLPAINMADVLENTPAHETETILINLAIMQILKGDTEAAKLSISTARRLFPPTQALTSLAAEYFYDFDDPFVSAELFSMLQKTEYSMRQADALWLAGDTDTVRSIWAEIIALPSVEPALLFRSLYNLAATSKTPGEAAALLERLIEQAPTEELYRKYGLIRYSRLQNTDKALMLLEDETEVKGFAGDIADVLIELEAIKRKAEHGEAARIIAETWNLLNRYTETEDLYHWGSWYFQLQRNHGESQILFDTARRQNLKGEWLKIHEALQCIYEGKLDIAETILTDIFSETGNWAAAANLGRIKESRREPSMAIEIYKDALSNIMEKQDELSPYKKNIASRIWFRIAECQKRLHKEEESRQSLKHALEMNPDNLNAILEFNN